MVSLKATRRWWLMEEGIEEEQCASVLVPQLGSKRNPKNNCWVVLFAMRVHPPPSVVYAIGLINGTVVVEVINSVSLRRTISEISRQEKAAQHRTNQSRCCDVRLLSLQSSAVTKPSQSASLKEYWDRYRRVLPTQHTVLVVVNGKIERCTLPNSVVGAKGFTVCTDRSIRRLRQ